VNTQNYFKLEKEKIFINNKIRLSFTTGNKTSKAGIATKVLGFRSHQGKETVHEQAATTKETRMQNLD